jgi:MoxR-like ATPase
LIVFLLKIELGYPDAAAERELLAGADRRQMVAELSPRLLPPAITRYNKKRAACTPRPR